MLHMKDAIVLLQVALAWHGSVEHSSSISKIYGNKAHLRCDIYFAIEEEISADTDVIFLIPFNNNCNYEYTMYRILDMKLNEYLCS